MMENTAEYRSHLRRKIEACTEVSQALQVIYEIRQILLHAESPRDLYILLSNSFDLLKGFTLEDMEQGKNLIITTLLPYFEQDAETPSELRSSLSYLQNCLVSWIDQYDPPERMHLRMHVLDHLLEQLQTSPQAGLCWAIGSIGYRREDIVRTLWHIVETRQNRLGDTALSTLVALGIPQEQRLLVLDELHRRSASGINLALLSALTHLADPSSIVVLCHHWVSFASSLGELERALTLGAFTTIAQMHPSWLSLQRTIWQHLVAFYQQDPQAVFSFYLGGNSAPYCNSEQVVPDLLDWMVREAGATGTAMHTRLLLAYRLEECFRPCQVRSWQKVADRASILDVLRQDACQDTRAEGRWATSEIHSKEAAWKTALCLGESSVFSWLDDAVIEETNGYVRQELCDLLACFRFDPLPPKILQWITETQNYTLPSDSAEFLVRLGALRLAWSAASREAFQALRACSVLVNGEMLHDTVSALRDVAFQLVHSGDDSILPILVETATSHPMQSRRVAALSALEFLVGEQVLSSEQLYQLGAVLLESRQPDEWEQRLLISLLGLVRQEHLPESARAYLLQTAISGGILEHQALCALARQDALISQEGLLHRLGLTRNGAQWHLTVDAKSLDNPIKIQILCLLYSHHPNEFCTLLASVMKIAHGAIVVRILWFLEETHLGPGKQSVPSDVAESLVERIDQNQTQTFAELDIFSVASRLIPERIAQEPWHERWSEWLPDARTALANALGEAPSLTLNAKKKAAEMLYRLTGDGQYAVRRTAYRGLASQEPTMLLTLCLSWQQEASVELRQRAAEAWAWLPFDSAYADLANTLYQALAADVEPSVRKTTERVRKERWRRFWAQEYFPFIERVITSQQTNQDVLSAWCYAQALTHVGDDTTIAQLYACLGTMSLRPHIRHWLQRTLKTTKENWQKAIGKWPQPWRMWQGTIEEGQGWLLLADQGQIPIHYELWYEMANTPSQVSAWGGTIHPSSSLPLREQWQVNLLLADGRQGSALVRSVSHPQGSFVVQGQGNFTPAV